MASSEGVNFLIKVPNIDFSILGEPLIPVKLELDEKKKARSAILFQIKDKSITTMIHDLDYKYIKAKELSARKMVKSKLAEIESLQSVINKAKIVISLREINKKIWKIEDYLTENLNTVQLEEKQKLKREIARLVELRTKLCHNVGESSGCAYSKHGTRRITEFKEKAEESLKIARKELDILKESALKAEAAVLESEKKQEDDIKQIDQLRAMSIAAQDVCYALESKLKILSEKAYQRMNALFDWRDDKAYYAGDPENFHNFCKSCVEHFMEMWNNDEEFRRQYVRMREKDEMVSDEDGVAASEMDEIKQESSIENTNWKTKKVGAEANKKKARGRKKRRRADKLISNDIKAKDRSLKEPQKSWWQSIAKSVPPSTVGNINKKNLQQVMWAGITSVFVYLFVFPYFFIKWRKLFY